MITIGSKDFTEKEFKKQYEVEIALIRRAYNENKSLTYITKQANRFRGLGTGKTSLNRYTVTDIMKAIKLVPIEDSGLKTKIS